MLLGTSATHCRYCYTWLYYINQLSAAVQQYEQVLHRYKSSPGLYICLLYTCIVTQINSYICTNKCPLLTTSAPHPPDSQQAMLQFLVDIVPVEGQFSVFYSVSSGGSTLAVVLLVPQLDLVVVVHHLPQGLHSKPKPNKIYQAWWQKSNMVG